MKETFLTHLLIVGVILVFLYGMYKISKFLTFLKPKHRAFLWLLDWLGSHTIMLVSLYAAKKRKEENTKFAE